MPTPHLLPKPVSWSKDPIWIELESDKISGGEATEPNLSCYVQIKKNDAFYVELNAPYDLHSGRTDFDLSGIMRLAPEAPEDGSMYTFSQGICENVTAMLELRYGDSYGNPVEKPGVLAVNTGYIIIYGHTPYWYGVGDTEKSVVLHSYYDPKGYIVIKEVRKSQPEYVYIFSVDGASVPISVEILYTDATSDSAPASSVTCEAGKVSWINVGWDAINMDSIVNPSKTVQSYIVKFNIDGDDFAITYALDDHDTDYDEYIMYENGIGGCEVVRCSGRHSIGVSVEKQYSQQSRNRDSSYRDGFSHAYNAAGQEVWQMNTGYHNQFYIRHLGQLFLAERVWYLDRFRDKFVSVTVRSNGNQLIDYENDLYSLPFTMTFDKRPAIGTFNI